MVIQGAREGLSLPVFFVRCEELSKMMGAEGSLGWHAQEDGGMGGT